MAPPRRLAPRAATLPVVLSLVATTWAEGARAEDPAPPAPAPAQAAAPSPTAAPPAAAPPAKESSSKASSKPEQPKAAREQKALESAQQRKAEAERSGNEGLARRLAGLSARWVQVIEALGHASTLEAEASALEEERIRVQEQTDRLVTLLEQTEARRARALAQLQALGLEPSALPAPAEGTR